MLFSQTHEAAGVCVLLCVTAVQANQCVSEHMLQNHMETLVCSALMLMYYLNHRGITPSRLQSQSKCYDCHQNFPIAQSGKKDYDIS